MKFTRGESVALFVLVVALIAALIFLTNSHYQQPYYQSYQDASSAEEKGPEWTDIVIALFTVVLTVATVAMWFAMRDTLKETRRSVDAFVDKERGIMDMHSAYIESYFKPEGTTAAYLIHYSFQNAGGSHIYVMSESTRVFLVPKGQVIPPIERIDDGQNRNQLVRPGACMVTTKHRGVPKMESIAVKMDPYEVSEEFIAAMKGGNYNLVFQSAILYRSAFRTNYFFGATLMARRLDQKRFENVHGDRLQFDILDPESGWVT